MKEVERKETTMSTPLKTLDVKAVTTNRRVEVISLGVTFVREVKERNFSPKDVKGLLNLIENLFKKEGLT